MTRKQETDSQKLHSESLGAASGSATDVIVQKRSENEETCSLHHTSDFEALSYKDGRPTFSGWMLLVEGCPESRSNFLGLAKTHHVDQICIDLLSRWKELGYPDLGEWPPQSIDAFAYSFGVLSGLQNKKLSHALRALTGASCS